MGGSRTSYLAGETVDEIGPKAIKQLQDSHGPEIVQELKNFLNNLLVSDDGDGVSSSDMLSCLLA
jgi:DNA-binding NtrC family response regulator